MEKHVLGDVNPLNMDLRYLEELVFTVAYVRLPKTTNKHIQIKDEKKKTKLK